MNVNVCYLLSDEYTRYACGLVGEYLNVELMKQLEDCLGFVYITSLITS